MSIVTAWLTSKLGALGAKIALAASAIGAVMLAIWRMKANARREGREQERARINDAWRRHEDRVVQDVERARADGPAAARERLQRDADGGA